MKKFLAILLLLTMCLGVLAACGGNNTNTPGDTSAESTTDTTGDTVGETTPGGEDGETATLEDAVAYLNSTYKSDEGKATPADYKLIAQIPVGETVFTVTWTVDRTDITITLADGLYTVKVPAKNDTEVAYKLTATVADAAGNTATKEFTRKLPVYDNSAAVGADDIKENTPYKLYLVQVGVGKTLFATTEVQGDNKYIKTDIDPKKGADFFVEKVEGGYKFYTEIGGVKNYVHAQAIAGEDGKVSKYIGYATESDCVYYFKADCNAWFVKLSNIEYVVGTYSSYETICISEGTYMTPSTTGVTQFPVLIMDKEKAEALEPTNPEIPEAEEKTLAEFIEIANAQPDKGAATLGKYIVTGKITEIKNTQYGNMNITDDAGNTLYIYGMYDKTGATRFDAMNPQPKVGDTVVLLGVACNYNGAQMKNAWVLKLNGEDYVGSGSTETPDVPDVPSVGDVKENTAYKFYLTQVSVGKVLYATAELDQGKFIKGTTDAKAALDFFAEKVEGGWKFSTTIDGAKMYLHAHTEAKEDGKISKFIGYAAESDNIWYYKADVNGWFVTIDGAEYVLGTYNTYETFSMSEAKHLTADNTGKTQFPGNLILKADAESAETPDTPATPDEPAAGDKTITEFNEIASAQPDKGATTTNKYTVTGVITEIKNTQYGNMYIEDEAGNKLYIYGLYNADGTVRFDAMDPQPAVGDTITVTGVACNYNGPQMKNGWVLELVSDGPVMWDVNKDIVTHQSFDELRKNGTAAGLFTPGQAAGWDMIANMTAEDTLLQYWGWIGIKADTVGLFGYQIDNGEAKFDAAWTHTTEQGVIDVALTTGATTASRMLINIDIAGLTGAGHKVTVLYKTTGDQVTILNVFTLNMPAKETPAPEGEMSITDFNEIASAQPDKGDATADKYTVTGKITEIKHTTYGNMYIEDDAGNSLYIYGIYSADGAVRFDKMNPQPKVGDTITVTGVACNYNGPQMKNGWVLKLNGADYVAGEPETEPAPELPAGEAAAIDFKDTANRTVGTTEQQVWVMNGITVTNNKGGATSNVNTQYNDPIRCYKGSDLEIAYTGMKKIVIVCNTADYAGVLASNAPSAGSIASDGNLVTITLDSAADKVSFTGLSAQIRIDQILVYTA